MRLLTVLWLAGAALASVKPTVFLIRHGEKPNDPEVPTLSPKGEKRAQCLRDVFDKSSSFDIGHIMAETPKENGRRRRPFDTVTPLAKDLGLDVDISCGKNDIDCVRDVVENYRGSGNILICWEHKRIRKIAKALGARHVGDYPKHTFDKIWILPYPYEDVTDKVSEDCRGLDD